MRFELSDVFKSQGLPVAFAFAEAFEPLDLYGEVTPFLHPVTFEGRAVYTDEVIVIEGRIGADYRARCGRCGKPVEAALHIDVTEEYARTEDETHPDRYLFQGDVIDFTPMVEDMLVLNMPMKHLCRVDCKGICPVCGADRNENPCGCAAPEEPEQMHTQNPFEALLALKKDMNEEDE